MADQNIPVHTENFITRWKASGASERANYLLFLTELCELFRRRNDAKLCVLA